MLNLKRLWAVLLIATLSSGGCSLISSSAQVSTCPPVKEYNKNFRARVVAELDGLPKDSAIEEMLKDYSTLRDQVRACQPRSAGGGGGDYEVIVFLCPVDVFEPGPRCDAWSVTDEKGPYPTFALCAARAKEAKDPDGWLATLLRERDHPSVNAFLGCREVREVTA